MVGWIAYRPERGRSELRMESIYGLTVLTACLYEPEGLTQKRVERRIRRLEQAFLREGISRVMVPDRFPYRSRLTLIRPVEPMTLYRAVADLLVLEVLHRKGIPPGGARAALAAPRLCPELCGAAERLCATVRELRIDVPGEDGEDFARYLQREYGVPVVPRTAAADAVIAFGETEEPADLCLWRESGIRLAAEGIDLPEEMEQPVLELLWEQGSVKREKLRVINLP